MEKILVSDVMTREPVTISSSASLLDCAKKMARSRVGSLLLIDKKKLAGFITQRDILWALVKNPRSDLSKIAAKDLSPKKIMTIKPDANLKEAVSRMNKTKFDRLPVINGNELVGIVTAKDILNFHPEVYPEFEEMSKIREEQEKLKRINRAEESSVVVDGICEECGERDTLYRSNGMLVCSSCRDSI